MSKKNCTKASTTTKNITMDQGSSPFEHVEPSSEMLSLSPTSDFTFQEEDEEEIDTSFQESEANCGSPTRDADVMADRLAFTYDPSILDDEGKPRNKLAKKMSRNQSEKMRRDRLNAYIAELARLVPLIMSSNRKLDTTSVLRLTVTYLRIYHDLIKNGHSDVKWKPDFLTYENLGSLLLESVGGFLLVINQRGVLIFATDAFTSILGHSLVDVLGCPISRLIHPEDEDILFKQFKEKNGQDREKNGHGSDESTYSGHRSFYLRMEVKTNKQTPRFENIHIVGHLKSVPALQAPGGQGRGEPELCLVGVGRSVSSEPIHELQPLPDTSSNQWITRHEMDGKITFSDQRGAWLTGFLPGESVGLSAYSLIHPEDISIVVASHEQFLSMGVIPVTVFRMYTKSRDILYVRTNTHMVVDMWTSQPKYIISINEVLEEEEGSEALENVRKKLLALPSSESSTAPGSVVSDSSFDEDDSLSQLEEGLLIPEIEEGEGGALQIVIGKVRYNIDLSKCKDYKQKGSASPSAIFDADVHKDDKGQRIPLVKPIFLGMTDDDQDTPTRSPYDNINAYMGNDPAILAHQAAVNKEINEPGGTEYSGRPPGGQDRAESSLPSCMSSGSLEAIEAMLEKSEGYPQGSIQQLQTLASLMKQQNASGLHCGSQNNIPHPTTSPTLSHEASSSSDYPYSCTSASQSTCDDQSMHNQLPQSSSDIDLQGVLQHPTTGAKQNPLLVQLLKQKSVNDSKVRETNTSHIVRDIGGSFGDMDEECKYSNDRDDLSECDLSIPASPDMSSITHHNQIDSSDQCQQSAEQFIPPEEQQNVPTVQKSSLENLMLQQQLLQKELLQQEQLQLQLQHQQQQQHREQRLWQRLKASRRHHSHNQKAETSDHPRGWDDLMAGLYGTKSSRMRSQSDSWVSDPSTQPGTSRAHDTPDQVQLLKEIEMRRLAQDGALVALRAEYRKKMMRVNHTSSATATITSAHNEQIPDSGRREPPQYTATNWRQPYGIDSGSPSGFHSGMIDGSTRHSSIDSFGSPMDNQMPHDNGQRLSHFSVPTQEQPAERLNCQRTGRTPSTDLCENFDSIGLGQGQSQGQGRDMSRQWNQGETLDDVILNHQTSQQYMTVQNGSDHVQFNGMTYNPMESSRHVHDQQLNGANFVQQQELASIPQGIHHQQRQFSSFGGGPHDFYENQQVVNMNAPSMAINVGPHTSTSDDGCLSSPVHQHVSSTSGDSLDPHSLNAYLHNSPLVPPLESPTRRKKAALATLLAQFTEDRNVMGNTDRGSTQLMSAIMADQGLVNDLLEQYINRNLSRSDTSNDPS